MTAMVGRARRNRRVRAAGVSVVATVAVVGVALGGAAVVRLNDSAPVPPAVTSTPSPTTTIEPAGTVLTCGAVIADLPVFEDAPVTVEATLDTPALTVTDPVVGTVVMAAVDPPGPMIANEVVFGLRYLVVQDGVVVGIGRDNGDAPVVPLSGRDGIAHEATISLSGCDEDSRTTVQLATGDYELYAGFSAQIAGGPGGEGVVLGGPWPFTITDAATTDEQTPETMPLLPPENHYVESSGVSAIPLSEDSLADGDYFGYLWGIDAAAGTVQADIAIFYTGQAANDYLTANNPEAENPPPNGYIIVNDVERIRTLTLSPDVRIWDWCYGNDLGFAERTLTEWAAAPATGEHSCDAGAALSRGWGDETYWFDVRDGVVMQVIGQFLP